MGGMGAWGVGGMYSRLSWLYLGLLLSKRAQVDLTNNEGDVMLPCLSHMLPCLSHMLPYSYSSHMLPYSSHMLPYS